MIFKRVTTTNDLIFSKAIDIYKISFPTHEQRETDSQIQILNHHEYHFDVIYEDELFVGIILYWETDNFIYIEHFAIDPSIRNGGYGSKILNKMTQKNKTLILEIDPPIDNISNRRKEFYKRVGFVENQYEHIHPPYKKTVQGHSLMIMTHPNLIDRNMYDDFNLYLSKVVMNL